MNRQIHKIKIRFPNDSLQQNVRTKLPIVILAYTNIFFCDVFQFHLNYASDTFLLRHICWCSLTKISNLLSVSELRHTNSCDNYIQQFIS